MTAKELHDDLRNQMQAIKEERAEYVRMVHNAKLDQVEYRDWPQYHRFIELNARWYIFREITEILAHIIDPTLEERDRKFTEATGIKVNICLRKRQTRQSY